VTRWREGESVMWWHDLGGEVGDASIGPSRPNG
jgi:hypothetical protein